MTIEQLKFVNHRIDEYALQVTYNPIADTGKVIFNLSLIREEDRPYAVDIIHASNKAGICVSDRMLIAGAGDSQGFLMQCPPGEVRDDITVIPRYFPGTIDIKVASNGYWQVVVVIEEVTVELPQ